MEIEDLLKLDAKVLKKLLNLMQGRKNAQNYKHNCSAQRICSTCGVQLCYACYNRHLAEAHGLEIAHFNAKIDNGSIFLPEQKVQPKPKTKQIRKVKVKIASASKGKIDLETVKQLLAQGILSPQDVVKIYKELSK